MDAQQWLLEVRSADRRVANQAFATLYKTAFPSVWAVLRPMGALHDDAKELFQQAMTILVEKTEQPDFVLTAQPATYLVAVARFKWLHQQRYQGRHQRLEIHQDDAALVDALDANYYASDEYLRSGENAHSQAVAENVLLEHLAIMDSRRRKDAVPCLEILKEFYVEKADMQKIAAKFKLGSTEAAKVRKHKCIRKFQVYLSNVPLFKEWFGLD